MNKKDHKTSISQKLKNISKKRDIRYSLVETEFLIERLLARITSDQKLNHSLIFKGGYVGMRVYHSPRYTIDLDALLTKANLRETLDRIKELAAKDIDDCTWFAFEHEVDLQTQGEYGGVRLTFRSGLGEIFQNIKKGQVINLDIGIGDPVTPGPTRHETQEMLTESKLSWQVYPIETIIAEKLHALITRGSTSSRSKDIFDLCQFLPKADSQILKSAIKACFNYRETQIPEDFSHFISAIDVTILEKGWANSTSSIKNAPEFTEAFNLMVRLIGEFQKK